ncbi:hypothetical protein [Ovoidimarina sediminis]|uniref:hypothetical protein n=1 Tax=Ovoidimarina sediminis TaxID=3079856 RepID=UPI00290F1F7B|nr:hypothetical protein [Rhodophyticola sp. MJ-SS7]MDU8943771.1 hypothetical protein [Rhodophyticola sp. MJ-SS7]
MTRTSLIAALLASVVAGLPATAQDGPDFSEGSEAKPWNLGFEQPAFFRARVVDMLCEVAGDCDSACTPGRQLGLLRAADGVLTFPNKNGQPAFSGAAVELLPFCGEEVEVDGLLIEDDYVGATNVYLVQTIRRVGDSEWTKASRWTKNWADEHPEAKGKGPWFRRDPRVLSQIAEHGYLGLGLSHQEAWDITR